MKNWLQRNYLHLIIIALFLAISFIYLSPVLQHKVLFQSDVVEAQAMSREIMEVKAETGKGPLWTNSMFGGMPAYQIWVQYPYNVSTYVVSFFKAVFPNPVDTVFLYLAGAYLLFCVLGLRPWLAAAGAIAFAFTSFNFILIQAGHSNQAFAVAFYAPILAGIILTLRGKYLIGASLTALFLAVEIRANHIQMTYYLFLAILILIGFELYHALQTKTTRTFFRSIGYLAAAAIISIGVNAGTLWTTYEYGKESIRGKANLSKANQPIQDGLDKEYAYYWSQGVGEMITFLIPDAYGGSTSSQIPVEGSEVVKTLIKNGQPQDRAADFVKQLPSYWGEKSTTSGPWYIGAIVCFLAIFGMFVLNDRIKWWVLSASFLFMFLSFGKHFPLISDLFFDYVPLYNKFRSVEFTLIIPCLLIPILAFLAVKKATDGTEDQQKTQKNLLKSVYIVAGFLILFLMVPTLLFSFRSSAHPQLIQKLHEISGNATFADEIGNSLIKDRISVARADAFRSLAFVLIAAGFIWLILKKKISQQTGFILLAVAVLVDVWGIDKRYLNNRSFVDADLMATQFEPRQADKLIKEDKSLDYRVLDLSRSNPLGDATPSIFHKSIGGRHSARLQRYQEMLDRQFSKTINEPVLDMLNTKYLIVTDTAKGFSEKVITRNTANGNAWFVPNVNFVDNAEAEINAISSFDAKKDAFIHREFQYQVNQQKPGFDPQSEIKLTSYHPDHLVYQYHSNKPSMAVFAEIWYNKGWKAYVDQQEIPYFRANYILRAAVLPQGKHELVFKFEPKSYYWGERISLVSSILLVGSLLAALILNIKKRKPIV